MTDKRRYRVIECHMVNSLTYHLTIDGVMWSEIEWSPGRQRWCVQDAAGRCLSHVEHIVGMDKDPQTAIRLAKKMIVSGKMPTPEEAHRQLQHRQQSKQSSDPDPEYLGEPMPIIGVREREPDRR